jgi:broad specificity phosphatase PhoE
MRIYLVTHAHTEQTPGVVADAWHLSPRGVEQATALAAAPFWDEVDRVVVTSEPKTYLTVAEIVRELNLPVWVDCRFDELRRGGWVEDYSAQVAAAFADPARSIGEWESVDSVRQRALMGLADVQKRFAGETVALVGHGICLSILRAEILGLTHVDFTSWQRLSFGSYASISLNPAGILSDFPLSQSHVR